MGVLHGFDEWLLYLCIQLLHLYPAFLFCEETKQLTLFSILPFYPHNSTVIGEVQSESGKESIIALIIVGFVFYGGNDGEDIGCMDPSLD